MKHKTIAFIKIQYSFTQGHHVFTSDDIDGLLVVSEDAETAYRDVAPSIKKMLKVKEGIECEIEPAMSFREFIWRITDLCGNQGANPGSSTTSLTDHWRSPLGTP